MTFDPAWDFDQSKRGWILVSDKKFTERDPFVVPKNKRVKIDLPEVGFLTQYSPTGEAAWWDKENSKFQPSNLGAMWNIRLNVTIEGKRDREDLFFDMDIGLADPIWSDNYYLSDKKLVRSISLPAPIYTLGTFVQNGGELYATGTDEFYLYDMSLLIQKLWNADIIRESSPNILPN
jgi:hypothetical protein